MKIELTSVGFAALVSGQKGSIKINGELAIESRAGPVNRGLNIAIVEYTTGKLKLASNFDTHGDGYASIRAQEFILKNANVNDFIAIIVSDEARRYIDGPLLPVLVRLGANPIIRFRQPWLFCCQVTSITNAQGRIQDIQGTKLCEKHADQEIVIYDYYEIELPFEREKRLAEAKKAADEAARHAANQTQIQAALTARKQEEDARKRAEAALLAETTNNTMAQLNNTVQQRRSLLRNLYNELNSSIALLTDLGANSAELVTTLNEINQRGL